MFPKKIIRHGPMIIGVTGTNGAGKGTLVDFLNSKGFACFSVRDFLKEEIARRTMPQNRDSMHAVGNDLREKNGHSYIIEQLFNKASVVSGNIVIESVRAVREVEFLKTKGALVWAVDADVHVRYARVLSRASETDHITFEKFVFDEERESHNQEPHLMNLSRCITMADAVFLNNGYKEELYKQIEKVLVQYSL